MNKRPERRLAAILAADVVGYSRLMSTNEAETLTRLNALRKELVQPQITKHNGRIVKLMGDGLLAEFPSVVEAVQCAIAIQEAMLDRNSDSPDATRIELRIGLNLGDIIVQDADIFGDGVNIAARLQEMAEPGGVALSSRVHEEVRDRLGFVFEDGGEHPLKNIPRPVRVWRWTAHSDADRKPMFSSPGNLSLLAKPSVAVLPFENMSGDTEQEYFADGISEDIITALSLWRSFPVIARNSTFAYKGQSVDVRQIADELGAQYVVEGSVRKGGERVRISAQLVDAKNGHHLWAERYDRNMADIFDLQDEITARVVSSIEPAMQRIEEQRAIQKRPSDLSAWGYIHRATGLKLNSGHGYGTKSANQEARRCLQRALELDPNSAEALAQLAQCEFHDAIQGWADDTETALERSLQYARQAVSKDEGNWMAYAILGLAQLFGKGEAESSVEEVRRAVALNPSSSLARHCLGCALEFFGEPEEAIPQLQAVFQLDPHYRNAAATLADLSLSNLLLGNLDEAVAWATKAATSYPDYVRGRQRLVAALGAAGRIDEARQELDELFRLQPDFSTDYIRATYPFHNDDHLVILIDGLVSAGLTK